jgi:hypothetical protein
MYEAEAEILPYSCGKSQNPSLFTRQKTKICHVYEAEAKILPFFETQTKILPFS